MLVELLPPATGRAFLAMQALRPALTDEQDFVARVDGRQRSAGYRLIASVDDDHGAAVAVAGFRLGDSLAWGRHLYVDDLSTLPAARNQGHAAALLGWLAEEAKRRGCGQIHLDSGFGPERVVAHRLYFNAGYRISSHHFSMAVSPPAASGGTRA